MSLIELEAGALPGVSQPTIDKIRSVGITSVQALSMQLAQTLSKAAGIGEDTADRAISKAVKMTSEGFITGTQLHELHKLRTRLTTGIAELDNLLGGGIESQTTTEISGAYGSGKSQICHTIAVLAQLPVEEGGLGGSVAWVDTEDTFRPERVVEIAESRGLDPKVVLDNIWHVLVYNAAHQKIMIEKLYSLCPEKNIKLIIVDSILGCLRSEFIGRGMLSARQDELKIMLHHLMKVSISTRTTVVYTNQVVSTPDSMYSNPDKPTGGNVMAHAASTRLTLRKKGVSTTRIAKLIDSSYLPPGEAPFVIDEFGVRDTKENRKDE